MEAVTKSGVVQAVRARNWSLRKASKRMWAKRPKKAGLGPRKADPGPKTVNPIQAISVRAASACASSPGVQNHSPSKASASGNSHGARAAVVQAITNTKSGMGPKAKGVKPLCFDASLETLVKRRETPSTTELLKWLKAVAHGGAVECEKKRMTLKPGIRSALQVQLASSFVLNHPQLSGALRSTIALPGSKWQLSKAPSSLRVAKKSDFVALLLRVRRADVAVSSV